MLFIRIATPKATMLEHWPTHSLGCVSLPFETSSLAIYQEFGHPITIQISEALDCHARIAICIVSCDHSKKHKCKTGKHFAWELSRGMSWQSS